VVTQKYRKEFALPNEKTAGSDYLLASEFEIALVLENEDDDEND
jgi:hypothetical protein